MSLVDFPGAKSGGAPGSVRRSAGASHMRQMAGTGLSGGSAASTA